VPHSPESKNRGRSESKNRKNRKERGRKQERQFQTGRALGQEKKEKKKN